MLAYAPQTLGARRRMERRRCYQVVMKKVPTCLDGGAEVRDDYAMTSTPPPAPRPGTHAARLAEYSAARPEIVLNETPAKRLPPRTRRHSVKHRAHR